MQTKRLANTLMAFAVAAPLTAVTASDDRPDFEKADADGNGKVTVSEATDQGVPKEEARREDIDNNGKLSRSDWKFIDMNPAGQEGSGSS